MLRQNMQAGLLPEKYIIGVTYKDIRLKTVAKREEASVATRLRICLERIIKIGVHGGFSSDLESLTKAVESAGKTKVVVSGGEKEDEQVFLSTVKTCMQAGACGMAVGRNIWQSQNPIQISNKIAEIIWKQ